MKRKVQRYRQANSRPLGGAIKCRYCKAVGKIEVYFPGDYRITQGWKIVWLWLWPVYVCPRCAAERVAHVREILGI